MRSLVFLFASATVVAASPAANPAVAQSRQAAIRTFQSVKGDLNRLVNTRNDIRRGGWVTWRGARWTVFFAAEGFSRVWIKQNRSRPCRARLQWLQFTEFCYKIRRAGRATSKCDVNPVCRSAIAYHTGHDQRKARYVSIDFSRIRILKRACGATAVGGTLRGCVVEVDFGRRLPFRYKWITPVSGRYVPALRKRCQTAENKTQWRTSNAFVFWSRSRRDRFVRALRKMRRVCRG
jgi:hypothetical protein